VKARRVLRTLALTALLVVVGGCYTLDAALPGHTRTDLAAQVEIVGSIDETFTHTYFVGGLLAPPPEDVLARILIERVRASGGDGVANLVFESFFTVSDVFVRTFSIGVVAPRTYRVRADIVRIHAPPLPGRPVLDAPPPKTRERGAP